MKEKTKEEFIAEEQKYLDIKKERNKNNIERLGVRLANLRLKGDEKEISRMENLIKAHTEYKKILDAIIIEEEADKKLSAQTIRIAALNVKKEKMKSKIISSKI